MAQRMFDRCDIADWELSFELGRTALEIPALRDCMPSFMSIEVLDQPMWPEHHDITEREAA